MSNGLSGNISSIDTMQNGLKNPNIRIHEMIIADLTGIVKKQNNTQITNVEAEQSNQNDVNANVEKTAVEEPVGFNAQTDIASQTTEIVNVESDAKEASDTVKQELLGAQADIEEVKVEEVLVQEGLDNAQQFEAKDEDKKIVKVQNTGLEKVIENEVRDIFSIAVKEVAAKISKELERGKIEVDAHSLRATSGTYVRLEDIERKNVNTKILIIIALLTLVAAAEWIWVFYLK